MAKKNGGVRNPDRTRRRLLAAAIRLFARQGYDGVSVDQIVAAAKANKRMVYHYFGDKTGIYRAAFDDVYRRLEQLEFHAVESGATPTARLTKLLAAYFDFLDANPEFVRLLLWENLAKGRQLAARRKVLDKNPFLQRFRAITEDGIARGEFRAELDVTHLLINLIGLCFIYHSNRFSLSQSLAVDLDDPKVKQAALRQVLALVFSGIAKR